MMVIPAIDIKDGKVVRLKQGRFDDVTVYSDDPVAFAKKWAAAGAELLHLVDLDGARTGKAKNFEIITKIATSVKIPVQIGGGIRKPYDIARYLSAGLVDRVILGTQAIENTTFLKRAIEEWKEKIVVSLDCSDGYVATKGWTSVSELKATAFAMELQSLGVQFLIYTDISRDGTLTGPNVQGIQELLEAIDIPVIASGGISKIDDIKSLLPLEIKGLIGVITGKAIYEGKIDLSEAIKLCSPKE